MTATAMLTSLKHPTVVRWQRGVPVYGIPLVTPFFLMLSAMAVLGMALSAYREFAGLGAATGMNDAYSWGIWKTFNVMVLTGLGSGGFAVGIAAWLFFRRQLHAVMRTAVLTSFIGYFAGLVVLGVDVGRPWNFYWVLLPWSWNVHSPMMEISLAMPLYAFFPLLLENIPPILERSYVDWRKSRPLIDALLPVIRFTYPWVVALAYALPVMHQSSLGALMLLAGGKVHPLWQTPMLPYLYLAAAGTLGFACVIMTLLMCCLVWKRPFDKTIMGELAKIMAWFTLGWTAVRWADVLWRGVIGTAFQPTHFAFLFWTENVLLIVPAVLLLNRNRRENIYRLFQWTVPLLLGGMLYRFDPTAFAFSPQPGAFYFPSVIEILISLGWISVALLMFLVMVKKTAILPAPIERWYDLDKYRKAFELQLEKERKTYVAPHRHRSHYTH